MDALGHLALAFHHWRSRTTGTTGTTTTPSIFSLMTSRSVFHFDGLIWTQSYASRVCRILHTKWSRNDQKMSNSLVDFVLWIGWSVLGERFDSDQVTCLTCSLSASFNPLRSWSRSVDIDASALRPGGRYRLCIDIDGSDSQQQFARSRLPICRCPWLPIKIWGNSKFLKIENWGKRLHYTLGTLDWMSLGHDWDEMWQMWLYTLSYLSFNRRFFQFGLDSTFWMPRSRRQIYFSAARQDVPLTILPLAEQTVGPVLCEAGTKTNRIESIESS